MEKRTWKEEESALKFLLFPRNSIATQPRNVRAKAFCSCRAWWSGSMDYAAWKLLGPFHLKSQAFGRSSLAVFHLRDSFFFLKPSLGLQVRIIGFCMVYFLTSFHSVKVVTCTTKWEADGWESHHHQSKTPTEPTTHSSSCHCTRRHPAEAQGPDPQCLTSSTPAGVKNKHLWEKWPQVTCKVLQAGTEPH